VTKVKFKRLCVALRASEKCADERSRFFRGMLQGAGASDPEIALDFNFQF